MQKPSDVKTDKILLINTEKQLFDMIVSKDHPFRKLNEIINWDELFSPLLSYYSNTGTPGIDLTKGMKALLVQFWEDYSDRQMEKAIKENMSVRWFCDFGLLQETPDYSYFSKLRTRIGTEKITELFNRINSILNDYGLFGNVFAFIDASAVVTKTALWKERDEAIKEGAEKLNNTNVEKYATDKDARWGAKSKTKYWFGYKRHESVDMRHGLVKKATATSADILDFEVIEQMLPEQGAVFMDKLYDTKETIESIKTSNCHSCVIMKNNNKKKNKGLDNWISSVRMPFESTFSKKRKRAKFRGLVKMQMQCVMEAIVHNLKKAVRFVPNPIPIIV